MIRSRWSGAYSRILVGLPVALLLLGPSVRTPARADGYFTAQIQTDGEVRALARVGNTLYFAGPFELAGQYTGGGVPLDSASGEALPAFPKVHGAVYAVAADGQGGWFIGGAFDSVGGQPRLNLAHVQSGLTVAAWAPNTDNSAAEVRALAVRD
jgi:hypothetical protein